MAEQIRNFRNIQILVKKVAYEMLKLTDDSPIRYIDWLTYVTSNRNVTSHIDSVLKDIQRASEEEAMEFEELIFEINA